MTAAGYSLGRLDPEHDRGIGEGDQGARARRASVRGISENGGRGPRTRDEIGDAELVQATLEGSDEAFHDLVVRYERPVFSVIVRMVRDRQRAEDLTQETFLKAYRALGDYDLSRRFSSWLFKIAHNATIDALRRRRLDLVALEEPGDEGVDPLDRLVDEGTILPEARAEASALGVALERAVARLRPEYREVVLLRYSEGLAYHEIAEITGLAMGTVKTHIHRARKQLAEFLAEEGWEPGPGRERQ